MSAISSHSNSSKSNPKEDVDAEIFDTIFKTTPPNKAKSGQKKIPQSSKKIEKALPTLLSKNVKKNIELTIISKPHREVNHNSRVFHRDAMGKYIPSVDGKPLSSLENQSPGPLDYDPRLASTSFQYSIQGKTKYPLGSTESPGPASNVSVEVHDKTLGYSFGIKLKELKAFTITPSPFAYNESRTIGKDGRSATISGWFPVSVEEVPGPDKFLLPSHIGENPRWSFGLKPELLAELTPGPQDYNLKNSMPSVPTAPMYTMRPKVKIHSLAEKETAPGPNQYHPMLKWSEQAASLKGHYKDFKFLKTPGPANYIIPSNVFQGPQYSLTPRALDFDSQHSHPGPTDYNPKIDLTCSGTPKYSLGGSREVRTDPSQFVPSPTAYLPKDRQIKGNDAPKVTLKGRHEEKKFTTPGPSDYVHIGPFCQLTAAQLVSIEARKKAAQKPSKKKIALSPGPADYSIKQRSIKRKSPAFSLGKRLASQKQSLTPSANEYSPSFCDHRQPVSMKSRSSPFVVVFPTTRFDTLRV